MLNPEVSLTTNQRESGLNATIAVRIRLSRSSSSVPFSWFHDDESNHGHYLDSATSWRKTCAMLGWMSLCGETPRGKSESPRPRCNALARRAYWSLADQKVALSSSLIPVNRFGRNRQNQLDAP